MKKFNNSAWMMASFIAGIVFVHSCGGGGGSATGAPSDADFAALQDQVAALETTLASVSLSGTDLIIAGVNLHIRNGSGTTDGAVDGLGNLIIGYDRDDGGDVKTGSHNLVIGDDQTYSSYGGLVAGFNNSITSAQATVSGGSFNTAKGLYSSVSGGVGNTASGINSSVSGGGLNIASGGASSVSGGEANTAGGFGSSISGGNGCTLSIMDEWGAKDASGGASGDCPP